MATCSLHVAVAVIECDGKMLLSRRLDSAHQGGKWEFPGGKLESGESVTQALIRELQEELGITPTDYFPLVRIRHEYPELDVLLDVWKVTQFSGEAHGKEGQVIQWCSPGCLDDYEFPSANLPIITAARLPDRYFITPADISSASPLITMLQGISPKCRLLQLRLPGVDANEYSAIAREVLVRCSEEGCAVMLTSNSQEVERLGAAGLHINSHRLMQLKQRPIVRGFWLSASCHNSKELAKAEDIGVDFVLLSPVQPTQSHPSASPLGWARFAQWVEGVNIPVFALGGVNTGDLECARVHGAQGISGIRGFW
jgi:8-oxo-dGTP diphosphatase